MVHSMVQKLGILTALSSVSASLAFAQEAGSSGGGAIMQQLLLFIPLILLFYFLLIRPQSQRQKQHRAMIGAIRRGDMVVTSGGLMGKVTKVADDELTVEISPDVRVRIRRGMISDVIGKGQTVSSKEAS